MKLLSRTGKAKGDHLHDVSAIPTENHLTENVEQVSSISLRATFCSVARELQATRCEFRQQSGQNGRNLDVLSYKQLGSCAELIEANIGICRQEGLGPAQTQLHSQRNLCPGM